MNLDSFDSGLKKAAVVLGILGGAAFTGLYPLWVGVIASFLGVLCGAFATSPFFSVTPEAAWNRVLQGLAAIFAAAAGSSQLEAVQKFVTPAHPAFAAKLGLGVMLGAQVFAFLAQRGGGAAGPARLAMLAVFMAIPGTAGCAHLNAFEQACKDCVAQEGPQVIKDLEANAAPALEQAFMCEADGGFDPNGIPPCLESALARELAGLGPDAERFRDCVVAHVENSPSAPPLAKKRAAAVRRKVAVERARNGR